MINKNFTATLALVAMLCTGGAAFAHQMDNEHGQWSQAQQDGRPDGGPDGHPGWAPLPPEKQELLHSAMESAHKKNEALGKQMYDLHLDMNKVIEADKFNKTRFLSDYEKIAALHAKAERNKADAFAAVAGKLTPEERKHVAMMVAGPHPGMMHHEGMHHPGGKGWGKDGEHHGKMGCDMHKGPHGKDGWMDHGDNHRANIDTENHGDFGHLNN